MAGMRRHKRLGWAEFWPWLLQLGLAFSLLLIFVHFADRNYRAANGRLGQTYPSDWQREIVAGIAPAPYVYRQGVPQLRELLFGVLKPGHAALAADVLFAVVGMAAGAALGIYGLGRGRGAFGMLSATIAQVTVYPHDKPNAVAMVGLTLMATALFVHHRHRLSALTSLLLTPCRPELAILLGASFWLATRLTSKQQAEGSASHRWTVGAIHLLPLVVGCGYLLACRFLLWPQAVYPEGTNVVMFWLNLCTPIRWPGLLVALFLLLVGAAWSARGWRERLQPAMHRECESMLGVGLFVVGWTLSVVVLGKVDEIRLYMPVLPLVFLLGGTRWSLVDRPL